MQIHRIEVPGLAHYSYVVSAAGKAAIIDPKRDVDTYLTYLSANDLKLTYILETHIHADFASGALELAEATGAELWLSGHDDGEDFAYAFPHHEFRDDEHFTLGEIRIVALHTPGHTPEHLSFLLYDEKRNPKVPVAMFSGDFLFVGSLGRPDLLGEAAKQRLAHELYRSAHQRIASLPDGVAIYPAHGAGSLCGSNLSDQKQSTLGYERMTNPYLLEKDETRFVQQILGSVPPFPDYYRRMKRVNSDGAKSFAGELPGQKALDASAFKSAIEKSSGLVLDLRRPESFGGAHIPGAINIGAGSSLAMWAAWVVPCDKPIYLVGDDATDIGEATRSLIRVGLDDVHASLKGGFRSWIEAGLPQAHLPQISVDELHRKSDASFVLDVRGDGEWEGGHIAGARHLMAGYLPANIGSVPRDRTVHVICGTGYRSSIAGSLLMNHGFNNVVNVVGGMTAWNRRQFPVAKEQKGIAA
jgi:hydroxyacylglutathione hydrolase